MSPWLIPSVVAAVVVLLVLLAAVVLLIGGTAIAFSSMSRGKPKMPRWQQKLVRDKVNKHLSDKAELAAVQSVVESVGFELVEE